MTKNQWKAVYDYCDENGLTCAELLGILRDNGTLGRYDTLEALSDYAGNSYEKMRLFLEEEI